MFRFNKPLICIPSVPFQMPIRFGMIQRDIGRRTEEKENAVENKWKDAVEKAVKKDAPLRLEVGNKYRTRSGEIVKIAKEDGSTHPFKGDNKRRYSQFGFHVTDDGSAQDHIVALVEDEPTQTEEPKKNPPLAVGQVWRTADGREAHIFCHKDRLFATAPDRWALNADGTNRWDASLNLVGYIGEANLDPKAEDVVQSKEIPLSEETTMSSKPQDRHESPQQDDRFTQYLIEECARLRDMLEQKDERIDELSRRLMEAAQESICKQKIMLDGIIALQMDAERKRAADRESLKKDDINALRELCSSNFDAVFEELSSIKISNIETAGDVAAVGGMLAAMQERSECPAPVPATPTAQQEDTLDKGLKLTNRTLTAAQIIWKIIQFTIAFSLFGGAATCAVMMLK